MNIGRLLVFVVLSILFLVVAINEALGLRQSSAVFSSYIWSAVWTAAAIHLWNYGL